MHIWGNKISPASNLRQVMIMNLNNRLHERAQTLNDGKLLAKLSGDDAIVQEMKYQHTYLSDLYNKERSHLKGFEKQSSQSELKPDNFPLVLSELVSYTIEVSLSTDGPAVFHLTDMNKLYQQHLEKLGVNSPTVNSTRLKEKLLT